MQARSEELIQAFHLTEYCDYNVSEYSGGVARRLDIAMSMISHPKVLFLDEPTVGLDIESRQMNSHIMSIYNSKIRGKCE
ncbi:ATP-binding cassette domain-containing protein [Paenibacillus oralis]|uniref:ATP-binding cassette domain-containing protein n=1 Tax=Paenibacillus oralis TaxID=2490856 RepID=UPI002482A989|nr:ATP-binding cassette domain-containing protein [Paenibacillus oralis]